MSHLFSLIVTDTSPLITLVLADSLDVLLCPMLPVSIPDAVYTEATRVRGAPGAGQIVEWINDNLAQVRIVPTETGIDQQRRLEEGRSIRSLGELAALEVLDRFLDANQEAEALLLFEDADVAKRRAIVDERVGMISTGDFLRELEGAGLIESASGILEKAARAGRNINQQLQLQSDHRDTYLALRQQIATRASWAGKTVASHPAVST
ncbi:MAG: hypothetical protein HQL58_08715 [Magnetococcales bacterium]|nr:hypothetical protein [Magnetococcales bacterium]